LLPGRANHSQDKRFCSHESLFKGAFFPDLRPRVALAFQKIAISFQQYQKATKIGYIAGISNYHAESFIGEAQATGFGFGAFGFFRILPRSMKRRELRFMPVFRWRGIKRLT